VKNIFHREKLAYTFNARHCQQGNAVFAYSNHINSESFLLWKMLYLCRCNAKIKEMERIVNLQIEKLPEGVYLATSDNLQGLVVQGSSITETVEIARDVAKKLIEAQEQQIVNLAMLSNSFNYPLVVSV
jgi:predicted RNase H-like HicB family nuclease